MKTPYLMVALLLMGAAVNAQNFNNAPRLPSLPNGQQWRLESRFSDDFNYNNKRSRQFTDKWEETYKPDPNFVGPGQTRWVRNPSSNNDPGVVQMFDGKLVIRAQKGRNTGSSDPKKRVEVRCGVVSSKTRITFPIYLEARIKVNNLETSSNFWMLNSCGTLEMDMLENYGGASDAFFRRQMSTNFHIFQRPGGCNNPTNVVDNTYQTFFTTRPGVSWENSTDWRAGYHTFGVYWKSETEVEYYIDGRKRSDGVHYVDGRFASGLNGSLSQARLQCPTRNCGSPLPNNLKRYNDALWLILDVESHLGRPLNSDGQLNDPSRNAMFVDWVRAYRPSGSSGGGSTTDLARNRPSFQSSTYRNDQNRYGSGRAVDGNTNSFNHTNRDAQAWWEVDLGSVKNINNVQIWNRGDCCQGRLSDYFILISDRRLPRNLSSARPQARKVIIRRGTARRGERINANTRGRWVRVQLRGRNFLHIGQVSVNGSNRLQAVLPSEDIGADPLSGGMLAYPSPTSDMIHISGIANDVAKVTIFDMNGKVVYDRSTDVHDGTVHIDAQQYESGIYLLHVNGEEQKIVIDR